MDLINSNGQPPTERVTTYTPQLPAAGLAHLDLKAPPFDTASVPLQARSGSLLRSGTLEPTFLQIPHGVSLDHFQGSVSSSIRLCASDPSVARRAQFEEQIAKKYYPRLQIVPSQTVMKSMGPILLEAAHFLHQRYTVRHDLDLPKVYGPIDSGQLPGMKDTLGFAAGVDRIWAVSFRSFREPNSIDAQLTVLHEIEHAIGPVTVAPDYQLGGFRATRFGWCCCSGSPFQPMLFSAVEEYCAEAAGLAFLSAKGIPERRDRFNLSIDLPVNDRHADWRGARLLRETVLGLIAENPEFAPRIVNPAARTFWRLVDVPGAIAERLGFMKPGPIEMVFAGADVCVASMKPQGSRGAVVHAIDTLGAELGHSAQHVRDVLSRAKFFPDHQLAENELRLLMGDRNADVLKFVQHSAILAMYARAGAFDSTRREAVRQKIFAAIMNHKNLDGDM